MLDDLPVLYCMLQRFIPVGETGTIQTAGTDSGTQLGLLSIPAVMMVVSAVGVICIVRQRAYTAAAAP